MLDKLDEPDVEALMRSVLFLAVGQSQQRFDHPRGRFIEALAQSSTFPLSGVDLPGVLHITSEHPIHFVAE